MHAEGVLDQEDGTRYSKSELLCYAAAALCFVERDIGNAVCRRTNATTLKRYLML
jgi:hypothetical protein